MTTHRAKLFRNGRSQAIRLPKECRFPEGEREVRVRRRGRRLIVEPLDTWSGRFLATAGALPVFERPPQDSLATARDPLDDV